MRTESIREWLKEVSQSGTVLYVRRLSAGDTSALQAHQRGPSLPRDLIIEIFGSLVRPGGRSTVDVSVSIASHGVQQMAAANWYDLKTFGGLRRESRLTGWRENSLVTSPASTGSVAAFAFRAGHGSLSLWLCRTRSEERELAEEVGPIEAGCSAVRRFPNEPDMLIEADGDSSASIPVLTHSASTAAQLLDAAASGVRGPADARFVAIRSRVLTLMSRTKISRSSGTPAVNRLALATEALRLQLERETKLSFVTTPNDDVIRSAAPAGGIGQLVVTTGLAGSRWKEVVNDPRPGTVLLSLQEGLDQTSCEELYAAGVGLAAPAARIAKYPVASRRNIQSIEALLADLQGK